MGQKQIKPFCATWPLILRKGPLFLTRKSCFAGYRMRRAAEVKGTGLGSRCPLHWAGAGITEPAGTVPKSDVIPAFQGCRLLGELGRRMCTLNCEKASCPERGGADRPPSHAASRALGDHRLAVNSSSLGMSFDTPVLQPPVSPRLLKIQVSRRWP